MRRMVLALALLSACSVPPPPPPPAAVPVAYEPTQELPQKVDTAMQRLEERIHTRRLKIAADEKTLDESAALMADLRAYVELAALRDRIRP